MASAIFEAYNRQNEEQGCRFYVIEYTPITFTLYKAY